MRDHSFQIQNNFHYDNIKFSNEDETRQFTKKNKFLYCLIYIFLFFLIFFCFFLNFVYTRNAFSDNKIVYLKPETICNEENIILNFCLTEFKKESSMLVDECNKESLDLQNCYDRVNLFNKNCYLYLSEYDKCLRDNSSLNNITLINEKCQGIINDISYCNPSDSVININEFFLNYK